MKELIKVEVLRKKMPTKMRPKQYEVTRMMNGGKHTIKPERIDKMKEILEAHHNISMAWLESVKSEYEAVKK